MVIHIVKKFTTKLKPNKSLKTSPAYDIV